VDEEQVRDALPTCPLRSRPQIFCACCLSAEADDDNDIVLCDGDCSRAYHLRCLQPPLTLADLPADEEEGWLCPACDAKVDAVYELNAAFDAAWPLDAKWSDFFAAEAAGAEAAAAEDWPSEDEEDADFDPGAARAEAAAAAAEEGREEGEGEEGEEASEEETESDDSEGGPPPPRRRTRAAGAAASASLPSSESESESEAEEAAEEAAVVLEGKRRRTAVNYVALAAEMFGSAEGGAGLLSDDDAEYVGASPLPSPVASPRAAAGEGPRRFPAETLAALRAAFAASQLPGRAEKEALAARAGLTLVRHAQRAIMSADAPQAQVSIWFNNARQKQKRAAAAAAPAGACEARRAPAGATTAALLSPPKSQWPIAPGSDGDDADFERGPSEPDVSMLSGEEAAEGRGGAAAADQGKQAAKTR